MLPYAIGLRAGMNPLKNFSSTTTAISSTLMLFFGQKLTSINLLCLSLSPQMPSRASALLGHPDDLLRWNAGVLLAALGKKERQQFLQYLRICSVAQASAFASHRKEVLIFELFEMVR